MSAKNSFVILLSLALFTATFAVNLHAPLYGQYASESTMGITAVTIAFGAYVGGLMPTLLFLGGLSDRVGRRLPIIIALLCGIISTVFLVLKPNYNSLIIARILLGVGTALVTTAGTAYMRDIMGVNYTRRAALIVTSVTSLGFAGGALATSISLGLQGPTLIPVSFIALFIMAPALILAMFKLPPVDVHQRVSLLRLPVFPKNTWIFSMFLALGWSTAGMIIAVVPLELKVQHLDGWTGLVIFLAIFIGFLCQPVARQMSNQKALALGVLLTPLGFFCLFIGVWFHEIAWILVGTCVTSSANYGFTYLAALSEVALRSLNNCARATAGLFIYAYVGFSLPVIASGVLADKFGLLSAMVIFLIIQVSITIIMILFWVKRVNPFTKVLNDSIDRI